MRKAKELKEKYDYSIMLLNKFKYMFCKLIKLNQRLLSLVCAAGDNVFMDLEEWGGGGGTLWCLKKKSVREINED